MSYLLALLALLEATSSQHSSPTLLLHISTASTDLGTLESASLTVWPHNHSSPYLTPTSTPESIFLHTMSLSGPFLGLGGEAYVSLQGAGITHIIHNAWPVNFNLSLASFSSHVSGVRALVNFCASVAGRPRLYFVSSLSSVTSLSAQSQVPEEIIFDNSAPSHMGYGESKYVAERILHEANVKTGETIASTVLRVGQIAGPVGTSTGIWPMREWLPSLVISSKCVGALPETLGRMERVDWIPVNVLADVIHELMMDGFG